MEMPNNISICSFMSYKAHKNLIIAAYPKRTKPVTNWLIICYGNLEPSVFHCLLSHFINKT
jgi:hypothetical protein